MCIDGALPFAPASLSKNTLSRNAPPFAQQPWHITTEDGRVDLRLTSQGERAERINVAGLMRSVLHQLFETFEGQVIDDAGAVHTINGAFGVTEQHILKA